MAITRRTTRYPKLPRRAKPKNGLSRELAQDVTALYGEIMDAEPMVQMRWPGWTKAENVLEHGLTCMAQVAAQTENREMAYKASGFLIEYAGRAIERAGGMNGNTVMAQLESLYRKALPVESEAEPLVVEEQAQERERG